MPQQEAAKMGNPEMARALLDAGANVNAAAQARPGTMKP
jgi:ankyrin repeat protein